MLICLRRGHVIDPVNGVDAVSDLWFEDGHCQRRSDFASSGRSKNASRLNKRMCRPWASCRTALFVRTGL